MKQRIQICASPILKSKTVIIERGLVVIERASIGPKFGNVLRREVNELPELHFALPDLFFCLLCDRNVHRRPDKFYEVSRFVQDRMTDNVEALDGSVGKNNTVVRLITGFVNFAYFK